MRLLLIGAFPYPHVQGSQVYFQEQAIALRAAGAEISLLTYATGNRTAPDRGRARDGFEHWTSPAWTAPSTLRSGPSWRKPLGDLGLSMTLRDAFASFERRDSMDAILTHNAEAALVALFTLREPRPAILYCAHTLLGNELSGYFKGLKKKRFSMFSKPGRLAEMASFSLAQIGAGIDAGIARRVDGWIALTQSSARVMRQFSDAPGALIPPAIPDPALFVEPLSASEVAQRHGLEFGRFYLYSGNLDAYQELDLLAAAAAELRRQGGTPPKLVLAHHANGERAERQADSEARRIPGIEFLTIGSVREMLALLAAARASLIMRRAGGGFPIKLVNSLAVGTPVIAFRDGEWGLEHERNALICPAGAPLPGRELARAIARLDRDDALAARLSKAARALYVARHRPEQTAAQTLDLVREVIAGRGHAAGLAEKD